MATSNPVPSKDPTDLIFNAEKLDQVVNGTGSTYTTRLGVVRKTMAGFIADMVAQVALVTTAKNTAVDVSIPAAVALVDTAVAETAAGAASAAKVLAQAAKVQAEAARDAALAAGKIFADTAAGLANTSGAGATNRYFCTPSGNASEYVILYLNNAGVAVEKARFASKLGIDNLVAGSVGATRASQNLLSAIAWNASTLLWSDGTTTAAGGYSASNFMAVWPGSILALICGVNHVAQTATVVGYNEAQAFNSVLHTGAVAVSTTTGAKADNVQYITIPAGVRYIKIGQQTTADLTVLKLISDADKQWADTLEAYLKTSAQSNLLGASRFYPGAAGAVATGNTTNIYGTGWIPLAVGDKIRWSINTGGSVNGIALYDSSKVFLRFLETNAATGTPEESYTLNSVDDASVAYMLGGAFSNTPSILATSYIYVSSRLSLARQIADTTEPGRGRGWRKSKCTWTNVANTTVADAAGGFKRIATTAAPAYVAPGLPEPTKDGYTGGFRVVKVQLVAKPGASASLYWHNPPAGERGTTAPVNVVSHDNTAQLTLTAVGETGIMYAPIYSGASIRCDTGAGVQYDILDSWNVEFSGALATPEKFDAMWSILAGAARIFEDQFSYADMAIEALTANRYKTFVYGKKVAAFGNSLTYTLWTQGNYLEGPLGCTITDCTTAGSKFVGNLTDVNLALIPADVTLVVISSGNTGMDPLAPGITSRDRATLEGSVNYAIDWIYTNRPNARVMMVTSEYCTNSGVAGTAALNERIRAICAYRRIPFADSEYDSGINESNYAVTGNGDGVHLGNEGKRRRAGVIVGKIRSLSA